MATAPLYRLQGHGDHFYTTSAEERDNAVSQYGYAYEGIACYVQIAPDPPVEPLPTPITIVPSYEELRERFAMAVLSSLIAGRHHAGKYVGDPVKLMPLDTTLAYATADDMMSHTQRRP